MFLAGRVEFFSGFNSKIFPSLNTFSLNFAYVVKFFLDDFKYVKVKIGLLILIKNINLFK